MMTVVFCVLGGFFIFVCLILWCILVVGSRADANEREMWHNMRKENGRENERQAD